MRLKEIRLERYGPLPAATYRFGEGINLIYGSNESGKTLFVDAFLKMTGARTSQEPELDRVSETPDGYMVLIDSGKEIKLDVKNTLTKYLDIDIEELRNTFVIRDADLIVEKEHVFYGRVTDKIADIRLKDIQTLESELLKIGRLTPKRMLADSQAMGWAKSQLDKAEELKANITEFLKEAEKKGIPKLEADLFDNKLQISQAEYSINDLETAKRKLEFESIQETFSGAKSLNDQLKAVSEDKLSNARKSLEMLQEKSVEKGHLERREITMKRLSWIGLAASALAFIITTVGKPIDLIGLLFPSLLLCLTIGSLALWIDASHRLSEIESLESSLINQGRELALNFQNADDLALRIKEVSEDRENTRRHLHEKLGILKNTLSIGLDDTEKVLQTASDIITEKSKDVDLELNITYDEATLRTTKEQLKQLNEKNRILKDQLDEMRVKFNEFATITNNLDFQSFLGTDLGIEIVSLDSLKGLSLLLDGFISGVNEDASLAKEALNILDALLLEEKQKVEQLFGSESEASTLFAKITQGRYGEVRYDSQAQKLVLLRPSGETLYSEQMSKGATDQLYLSIRIALGRKLLGAKSGFYVMDDVFLASDSKRLAQQLMILKQLAEDGWQIIYLTAKDEARKAIEGLTENDTIELNPLP